MFVLEPRRCHRHGTARSWPKRSSKNELVMDTDVYKDGHIVYLENPTVWYTAEGGITALDSC